MEWMYVGYEGGGKRDLPPNYREYMIYAIWVNSHRVAYYSGMECIVYI